MRLVLLLAAMTLGCWPQRLETEARPVRRGPGAFDADAASPVRAPLSPPRAVWPIRGATTSLGVSSPGVRTIQTTETDEALLVRFRSAGPFRVAVAGGPLAIEGEALAFVPLVGGALSFEVLEGRGALDVTPIARVSTIGGGFEPSSESAQVLATSPAGLRVPEADDEAARDTFARLVRVAVERGSSAVDLGPCVSRGAAVDPELRVEPGTARTAWLKAPALCVRSDGDAAVRLETLGRVRRFSTTSLEGVRPAPLLDTRAGVRFRGAPRIDQTLELDLSAEPDPLLVDLAVEGLASVSRCDAASSPLQTSGPLLLERGRWCVKTSGAGHVALTAVARLRPRSEAVEQCPPPPPSPCEGTLLERLRCVRAIAEVTPIALPRGIPGAVHYELQFQQPVDHTDPGRGVFRQKALLSVVDEAAPMVLQTTGYEVGSYASDLSRLFEVNQLDLEHRFFDTSSPPRSALDTLSLMQSAADAHRVVEALRPLFPGRWVGTGYSKGGVTAVAHRRFYPCDVDATVPYSAPFVAGLADERFLPWLETLGGEAYAGCRQLFFDVDRELISRLDEFAPQLQGSYLRVGGPDRAVWMVTGPQYWGLFQAGMQDDPRYGCGALASADRTAWVRERVQRAEAYADQLLEGGPYSAYYHQTLSELGAPARTRRHLSQFGVPRLPAQAELLVPPEEKPVFEPRANADLVRWVEREGERLLFLYGTFDPWTAGAVTVPGARDSSMVMHPGGDHGVSVLDLAPAERRAVIERLERWLKVGRRQGVGLRASDVRTYREVMGQYPR